MQGAAQPFYHVFIDARDCPEQGSDEAVQVAYVAQEQLRWPAQEGKTWLEEFAPPSPHAELQHPLKYHFFLGPDAQGDFIPTAELRSAYHAKRQDVYPKGDSTTGGAGQDGQAPTS